MKRGLAITALVFFVIAIISAACMDSEVLWIPATVTVVSIAMAAIFAIKAYEGKEENR